MIGVSKWHSGRTGFANSGRIDADSRLFAWPPSTNVRIKLNFAVKGEALALLQKLIASGCLILASFTSFNLLLLVPSLLIVLGYRLAELPFDLSGLGGNGSGGESGGGFGDSCGGGDSGGCGD